MDARPGICQLCISPYRKEILQAYKNRVKSKVIWEKYRGLMRYTGSAQAFYVMIARHIKKGHVITSIIVPEELKKPANLESLVNKLTELAALKVESMDASDVKMSEVFAGHRVLLESKKLKLTEDAMTLALTQIFGPTIKGEEIQEGEIAHELLNGRRAEDGGVKQEDSQ